MNSRSVVIPNPQAKDLAEPDIPQKTVVSSRVPELQDDEIALALRMLKNVQLTNGKPFVRGRYGKYLIPLAVRYNGDDPDLKPGEMPRYAIFFSLPYFDLKPLLKLKPVPKDTAIYPTRTLLQSHHRLASTEERDKKQAFRKLGQSKNEHVLYLPQLWCLVIQRPLLPTLRPTLPACLGRLLLQKNLQKVRKSSGTEGAGDIHTTSSSNNAKPFV